MKFDEARNLAILWCAGDRNRAYGLVAPTGSMLPLLASNCVLLLERAGIRDLAKNNIALYAADDGSLVCHFVTDIHADSVYFDGCNNPRSDGWIAADRVRWRVVAIFYTDRLEAGRTLAPLDAGDPGPMIVSTEPILAGSAACL
jgi:hypothetical protein